MNNSRNGVGAEVSSVSHVSSEIDGDAISNNNTPSIQSKISPTRVYPSLLHAAAAENAVWAYTESDFLNSNCSCDDPCESFSNGQLRGHDFLLLRRYFVGDKDKEKAIVDSVLQPIPCSIATVPSCNTAVFSVSSGFATIANDIGT